MKTSILTLGTIIAFVAGSTLLSGCGPGNQKDAETQEQHDMDSDHDHEGMDDMEITANASCPMHPEITGKEGDKCSKCGMTLVLNETDHLGDEELNQSN